jgi:hypothetical protein
MYEFTPTSVVTFSVTTVLLIFAMLIAVAVLSPLGWQRTAAREVLLLIFRGGK